MDIFAIVASVLSGITLAIVGWSTRRVASFMHDTKAAQEARNEILKCTARRDIFECYERYIVNEEKISVMRYDEIVREFAAYKKLGGNGTAKSYMEAIEGLKPFLITD